MSAVVIGGANMDVKARSGRRVVPGTSNPGRVVRSPGGVGRNVAENLARLGTPTVLVAAVGSDALGDELVAATSAAGVDVRLVRRVAARTGTYVAVLDDVGELIVAVSDMAATEALTASDVRAAESVITGADLVVLDGNLPRAALTAGWDLAVEAAVPVVLDPVSVPKAAALADLVDGSRPLFAITPNLDEVAVLGRPAQLLDRGVELVWVRAGVDGSTLVTREGSTSLPAEPAEVVDVTGAGDAMLAAFCHGVLSGADAADAARLGHAAAALTVASPATVRPDLSEALR
ncbi:MAG TPA: carbohydrate kinase family protein [Nocardioides sp.]|nr:carbohydrate kinase family protein [Nocardioides sp.]